MSTTDAILKQIQSLGYAVSEHRIPSSLLGTVGACVDLHAVKVPEGSHFGWRGTRMGTANQKPMPRRVNRRRWRG
jgi:hypothetical protein